MARFKLKEDSLPFQNLERIFQLMEEAQIGFEYNSYGGIIVSIANQCYELREIEDGRSVTSIPPAFEFKLTYEKQSKDEELKDKFDHLVLLKNRSETKIKDLSLRITYNLKDKFQLNSDEYKQSLLKEIETKSKKIDESVSELQNEIKKEDENIKKWELEILQIQIEIDKIRNNAK